jgi:GNAT superfamily N-acetyltransferase
LRVEREKSDTIPRGNSLELRSPPTSSSDNHLHSSSLDPAKVFELSVCDAILLTRLRCAVAVSNPWVSNSAELDIDRVCESLRNATRRNATQKILGAFTRKSLVCTCTLTVKPTSVGSVVWLTGFCVAAEYRSKGIGSLMMRSVLHFASVWRRAVEVYLNAPSQPPILLHFYERHGFLPIAVKRGSLWTGDEWIDQVRMRLSSSCTGVLEQLAAQE